MPQFLIALEASRDLNEIVDYFQARDLDAGDRFIAAFNQKCEYLTQFPNMGKCYSPIPGTESKYSVSCTAAQSASDTSTAFPPRHFRRLKLDSP
jgi:plasmid stabilization system protein ParE